MIWTSDMIAILRSHWGMTRAKQIGDMIGKSKNAVIGKANRLGLKALKISPKTREAAVRNISCSARIAEVHERMTEAA